MLVTPSGRTTNRGFVIEVSVPKVTRRIAADLGAEYGIRPFHSMPLMRLERGEAIELVDRAAKLYPSDSERRGEFVRRVAARGER